jgi:hypothetical protein
MLVSVAVMAREAWTDERLDDFRSDVGRRFDQVDQRFDRVDQRFDRVEADIRELRTDVKDGFESMHRMMIAGIVTVSATIGASVVTGVLAILLAG